MGVEVRPLGVRCNIACRYCYQEPIRIGGERSQNYDLAAIKQAVLAKGGPFILFGGEPLLMPLGALEELFAWGLAQFGSSSIQTNGVLLTEAHLRLFRTYRVKVGISIDGPGELNGPRWAGSAARTAAATAKVERAIADLLTAGLAPSLITTLHRANASAAALPRLLDWFRGLDRQGLRFARIHILEVDTDAARQELALSDAENAAAMLALGELERLELRGLRFDLFGEIRGLLLARDRRVSCVWRACDPLTTEAVQGIEGHGETSNCGRVNKAGVDYLKAERPGYERYLALYRTPQGHGGCAECRFFLMCKGQCPGTGIDGDWRNRTEHCATWFRLFEHVEARLAAEGHVPISQDPNRGHLEAAMLAHWASGRNPPLAQVLDELRVRAAKAAAAS